ncbi:MAG: glycoside hydrolase family 2 protein [Solobacterium sp.]|nr:glycoside hydrolase family 2 protein [Solobacterium sp.]
MKRINNNWQFVSEWSDAFLNGEVSGTEVRIPHTVKELPLHYINSADYQMVSGYRKVLYIPEEYSGKRLFLQFDAAAHIATVYANGNELYTHKCGYTAFRVEITDYVEYGSDNVIAVKLDSTENPSIPPFGFVIDYLTYGGIYRDVWLDVRNSVYLKDVYVRTPEISKAVVEYKVDGNPEGMLLETEIIDQDGITVKSLSCSAGGSSFEFNMKSVIPWNTDKPYLYTARFSLKDHGQIIDTVEKKVGFRTVSTDNNNILINGRPVFIRGLNRHQCWPYIGYAVPESLQREDARILDEELCVNSVRTSHYPQSHYFLDECDRRGILVFTEIPGWQHLSAEKEWLEQCIANVRDMIIEYRQHPSVYMWGVRVNESQDNDDLYRRTNAVAHDLDPDRPTSGVRYLEKSSLLEDVYAYNDFSHNGLNKGAKAKKDVTPDMKKPLIISEANGHMYPTKPFDNIERRQEHALRYARVLDQAMLDGGHAGCYEWCMFDYPTHQDFGSGDRICYHGVMDSFRNPKMTAAVYASQGDEKPVLEVGSPMDIGDYPAGQIGSVYCFTNADEVELYKNGDYVSTFRSDWKGLKHGPVLINDTIGKLLETNEGMDPKEAALIRDCMIAMQKYGMANLPASYKAKLAFAMARYHLTFADGYNLYGKYVGNWGGKATEWRFDAKKNGRTVASVLKTPDSSLHLEVRASSTVLTEGETYDMAAVRIRVLDANGNSVPYAQIPVKLQTSGEIQLVGPDTVCAEGGMTGTYIRTTGKEGKGMLKISTFQTEPVEIEFEIKNKGE